MSDIEQALAELDMHNLIDGDTGSECDCGDWEMYDAGQPPTFNDHVRSAILATPSMQAIARQAAIGAAVERLTDAIAWTLRGGPDGSHTEAWNTQTGAVGTGDSIPAAIAAALGEDDDLVEPPSEALWRDQPPTRWASTTSGNPTSGRHITESGDE